MRGNCNKGMSEFIDSQQLFKPEYFDALVREAQVRDPNHRELNIPSPLGVYVLLKLKPYGCSLRDFCEYMGFLYDLRVPRGPTRFDCLMDYVRKEVPISFRLDDTLDRNDLLYLFSSLINVPFDAGKIPTDATGISLINGGLEDAFKADDYEKVQDYIIKARKSLQRHMQSLVYIIEKAKLEFESSFKLSNVDSTRATWAETFIFDVFPNIQTAATMVEGSEDAFILPYLFRDEISRSFIEYIENMINPKHIADHFACYSFLGQSSCSGKTRLLSESLETKEHAVFIVNINCKPKGETMGYPHANSDSEIVEYIKRARSFSLMSNIISTILYLVIQKAFEKKMDGNYYVKVDGLSKSLDDLGIRYEEVANPRSGAVGKFLYEASRKLKAIRGDRTKDVTLLIAFDEAGYLIDRDFPLVIDKDKEKDIDLLYEESAEKKKRESEEKKKRESAVKAKEDDTVNENGTLSGPTILNTFRLIRRVLCQYKYELWNIPFVFAGTNTRFANFIPSKWNNPSARTGFGPNDEKWDGVTLFDPYILLEPFDVYAMQFNKYSGLDINWKDYIFSPNYMYHLCNIGRPMWGGLLSAGLKKEYGNSFIENPGTGSCIPLDDMGFFNICLTNVYKQAAAKIHYDKRTKKDLERIESAVALMNVIAGAGWISGPLAHNLVERRMAVLLDYRYDTSQSRVIYPSEPMLAINSLLQFHANAAAIINDVIIFNDCSTGSTGQIGELVSRIILLLALDGINSFQPVVPLRSFLKNLMGDGLSELEVKANEDPNLLRILNGHVSFSHFARVHNLCELPLGNIGILVSLNAALCAVPNYPGIDNLIPVILEDGELGCVSVQVKSHASRLCPSDIRKVMTQMTNSGFYSKDIPNLNIIINLCPYIEHSCDVIDPSVPTFEFYTVVIQGISESMAIFKKEEYKEILHKLVHVLKINRFEVDFRGRQRKLLPVTTDFRVYRRRTWGDWKAQEDKERIRREEKKEAIEREQQQKRLDNIAKKRKADEQNSADIGADKLSHEISEMNLSKSGGEEDMDTQV
jgi:hypothetical protein